MQIQEIIVNHLYLIKNLYSEKNSIESFIKHAVNLELK